MPEWLIWGAAIWLLFSVAGGRSCGRARHDRWRGHPASPGDPRLERPDASRARRASRPRRVAAPPPETAEQRLQRQFVEGRLSLEEYEAALWREIARPATRPGAGPSS